ncbi:MAG: hypothetical protein ACTHK0_02820 [Ginsengibacter sp.]
MIKQLVPQFLLAFYILIFSCSKPANKNALANPYVDIHYIDTDGNTLFTNNDKGYIKNKVRTYTLINGEKSLDTFISTTGQIVYNPIWFVNRYDAEKGDSVLVGVFGLPLEKVDYKSDHYFTTLLI